MQTEYTVRQFLEKVISEELQDVVEKHPYLGFVLLATTIEFLGKCLNPSQDWQSDRESKYDFSHAIQTYSSLQKYKIFNTGKEIKNGVFENNLYFLLRCGMAHAMSPKQGIRLCSNAHDLAHNKIGCQELYVDITEACKQLLDSKLSNKNLDSKFIIVGLDGSSGVTSYDHSEFR